MYISSKSYGFNETDYLQAAWTLRFGVEQLVLSVKFNFILIFIHV